MELSNRGAKSGVNLTNIQKIPKVAKKTNPREIEGIGYKSEKQHRIDSKKVTIEKNLKIRNTEMNSRNRIMDELVPVRGQTDHLALFRASRKRWEMGPAMVYSRSQLATSVDPSCVKI